MERQAENGLYVNFFIPSLEFGTGINKVYIANLPPINLELSLACVWRQRATLPGLYSLNCRCSFGPVVSCNNGSRAAYVGRLFRSLELAAGRYRCVLVVQLWLRMWEVKLLPRGADQIVALCSVVMMIRA